MLKDMKKVEREIQKVFPAKLKTRNCCLEAGRIVFHFKCDIDRPDFINFTNQHHLEIVQAVKKVYKNLPFYIYFANYNISDMTSVSRGVEEGTNNDFLGDLPSVLFRGITTSFYEAFTYEFSDGHRALGLDLTYFKDYKTYKNFTIKFNDGEPDLYDGQHFITTICDPTKDFFEGIKKYTQIGAFLRTADESIGRALEKEAEEKALKEA